MRLGDHKYLLKTVDPQLRNKAAISALTKWSCELGGLLNLGCNCLQFVIYYRAGLFEGSGL